MKKITIEQIRVILKETFPNTLIPDSIQNLQMNDFGEWDSMGNFNLLLAIEEFYGLRMSLDQMERIKSIKQIIEFLESTDV